jgi:hypothetical protein
MDWTQVLAIFTVIIANLGTIIALYIQMDRKIDENRKETNDILRAIQQEMRDFHGRLERIDTDFKNHIMYCHGDGDKLKH